MISHHHYVSTNIIMYQIPLPDRHSVLDTYAHVDELMQRIICLKLNLSDNFQTLRLMKLS